MSSNAEFISSLSGPAEGSESAPAPASEPTAVPETPATVEAPALAPEPAPEAKPTPEAIEQNHLAALREARGEIKALRQQITALEAQPKLSAADQTTLAKLRETEQATQEQEPDFLADPKGYVDSKVKAALAKLDEANKKTNETAEQVKQREQREQVWQATQTAEQQFFATTPDYPQALEHIRSVRTQQLQMMAPEATAEQIRAHIAHEEMNTAAALVGKGKNPAEFAYQYAKTIGYAAKPAAAPAAPAVKPDRDAIRTLGSGGGDAPVEDAGNSMPEFTAALSERFKRRR
jgi:hypothetical protein